MEPKLPMPDLSPEKGPSNQTKINSAERGAYPAAPELSAVPLDSSERTIEQARERLSGVGAGDIGGPAFQSPIPAPTAPSAVAGDPGQLDDTPLVAADDDLIEQEWVKKAKNIVMATRDDPYSQEREVSRLQASYLQKRYGKEIKLSNQ